MRIAAEKRRSRTSAHREAQLRLSQVATAGQRLALSLTASQEIHRRLVRLTSSDAIAALSATTGVSSPGATAASSPSSLRRRAPRQGRSGASAAPNASVASRTPHRRPTRASAGRSARPASFYAAPADVRVRFLAPLAALLAAAEATAAESGGALRAVDGAAPAAALAAGRVALMWAGRAARCRSSCGWSAAKTLPTRAARRSRGVCPTRASPPAACRSSMSLR